jgi:chemotaxis protein CheX
MTADAAAPNGDNRATTNEFVNATFSAAFLLERLRGSVVEVFQVLLGTSVAIANPDLEPASFNRTAIVGLAGKMCGVVEFCCHAETANLIASRMLHVNLGEAQSHALDAIGEMCNVIAGNFKHHVDGLGDGCSLSPPTIVEGTRFRIHFQSSLSLTVTADLERRPVGVVLQIKSYS